MSRLPRYPAYRSSSTKLLPDPPAHWSDVPIWTMFTRIARKGYRDETLLSVYREHGVVPKASRDDNFNRASDDLSSYQLVMPGDLAVNKMKAWQGSVSISKHRGIVSPAYFVYVAHHQHESRYLHHLLRSMPLIASYRAISSGVRVGQWDLDPRAFSRIKLPMPPIHEQAAIADYLDRETAQIDTLIAKQEQLVSVLEERRALVIAETTAGRTKGADTSSSAVEWLGEIDSRWPVVRVRHIADVGTGYGDTIDADPDGRYPFYVRSQTPQRSNEFDHIGPAVLTAGDGAGVAKVFHLATGKFRAHQRVYVINGFRHVLPEYFLAYFSAYFNRVALDGSAKSTVDSVRRSMITDMPIPLPPLDEQRRIVAYLDEQTAKIDALIAKAERFIELAKERRAALITAAVTGQLDVTAA